jgi:hypothetical protein
MAGRGTVTLRRQLGPVGIVFQRWQKVRPDESGATVSSFGAVPIASLEEGHAAISIREDESVWIGFEGSDKHAFAARVFARGTVLIDAVTGNPPTEMLDPRAQNYIVVPPQYAITGRTTAPGCARQFVRVANGPHQETIAEFELVVHPSTSEQTVRGADLRRDVRVVGPTRPRRADAPRCPMPGHVAQVIQEDPFGAAVWDTTRAWRVRIEVLAGDEYQRRTGEAPLPAADRRTGYGGWRMP